MSKHFGAKNATPPGKPHLENIVASTTWTRDILRHDGSFRYVFNSFQLRNSEFSHEREMRGPEVFGPLSKSPQSALPPAAAIRSGSTWLDGKNSQSSDSGQTGAGVPLLSRSPGQTMSLLVKVTARAGQADRLALSARRRRRPGDKFHLRNNPAPVDAALTTLAANVDADTGGLIEAGFRIC